MIYIKVLNKKGDFGEMRKKVLPMLLALFMFVALLPVTVHAQDYAEWNDSTSLPESGVYKLMTDVVLETEFSDYPTIRGNVVLDLNGHTVKVAGYGQYAYFINSGGSLIIEDSVGSGKITNEGVTSSSKTLIQVNGGSFTLTGGTLENTASSGYALFANSGSDVTISGGTVLNVASSGKALHVNGSGTKATVNGGTVENTAEGAEAVYVNNGTFSLESGTVKTSATYSSKAAIYVNNSAESVVISGGTIESATMGIYAAFTPVSVTGGVIDTAGYAFQTRNTTIDPAEGSSVTVNSGKELFYTFSGSANAVHGGDFNVPGITKAYTSDQPSTTTITGGAYSTAPTEYVSGEETVISHTGTDSGTVYVVGSQEEINAAVGELAQNGSKIDVVKGDAELTVSIEGVEVTNSGNGTVSVNNQEVEVGEPVITHANVQKVEEKAPTCTEAGNKAYWYCEECGKYYADAELSQEIAREDTIIAPTGHKAEKVPAKEATAKEDGNIEYWYCAECGTYFKDAALTQEITQKDTVIAATGEKNPGKDNEKTNNKTPDKAAKLSSVPVTGDTANITAICIVLVVAAVCVLGTIVAIRKNKVK